MRVFLRIAEFIAFLAIFAAVERFLGIIFYWESYRVGK